MVSLLVKILLEVRKLDVDSFASAGGGLIGCEDEEKYYTVGDNGFA